MSRVPRIAIAAVVLLLLVAGTALATRTPHARSSTGLLAVSANPSRGERDESNEPSESPEANEAPDSEDAGTALSSDEASRLVSLLAAHGITATVDQLTTLAAKYGIGGAVRLMAWAKLTGKTVQELAAMFDGGMGWGAMARRLGQANPAIHVSPGIGWIMGHGHGANAAPKAHASSEASPAS